VGAALEDVIQRHGFLVNPAKVRLMRNCQRQLVTGLVVNSKIGVPKEYRANIRAMLHSWRVDGPAVAAQHHYEKNTSRYTSRRKRPAFERVVVGRIEHVGHIYTADYPRYSRFQNTLWHLDKELARKMVINKSLKLIQQLQELDTPWFISFRADESETEAMALAKELEAARLPGFVAKPSESLPSGQEWKVAVAKHLRNAGVVFLFESENFHESPACQVERDFAIASHKRVIRVLLAEASSLKKVPPYLDDLEYVCFVGSGGQSLLYEKLLRAAIPEPPSADVQVGAVHRLVETLNPSQIEDYATKLRIKQDLPLNPSETGLKTAFVEELRRKANKCEAFCNRLDLSALL